MCTCMHIVIHQHTSTYVSPDDGLIPILTIATCSDSLVTIAEGCEPTAELILSSHAPLWLSNLLNGQPLMCILFDAA